MSKSSIKGITIEIEGKSSGLTKALKEADAALAKTEKALKEVEKSLQLDPSNVELTAAKQELLAEKTKLTSDRLEILKQVQKDALTQLDKGADVSSASMAELSAEIVKTEKSLDGMEDSSKDASKGEKEVGDNAEKAGKQTSKFGTIAQKAAEGAKKAFELAAKAVAAAGAAIAAGIGKGISKLVEFSKESVQVGMNFDSSMSQVAATMGKTVDEIQDLREFAKEMGSTTQFSASQAADGLNYMALAGYSAEDAMKALPTVLNLAAAGGMELATASDMVTDAASALGLSMEETSTLVDQMAKGASTTNTSVSQLGEAMLKIGGTAQLMSGGTQELATALGLLADNGIKGAEGGTHLRNVLLSLANPTTKGYEALEKLGVDAYDASGKMRPLQDIVGDLNGSLSKLTDAQRTQAIGQIFNKADIAAVNALLNTSAERWTEVSDAIGNAGGSAAEMANTQLDNLAGDVTKFQSALEGLQIAVSDSLNPALRELTQIGTEAIGAISKAMETGDFSSLADELGGMADKAMETITANAGPILDTLTKVMQSVIGAIAKPEVLSGIVTAVTDIITMLNTSLLSPENVTTLMGAAQSILMSLVNGLLANLDPILQSAVSLVTALTTALLNPETLSSLLTAAIGIIMALVTSLSEALPELVPVALEAIMTLVDSLLEPSTLSKLITSAVSIVVALASGIADALPRLIPTVVSAIGVIVETLLKPENLNRVIVAAIQIIGSLISGLIQSIPEIIAQGPRFLSGIVEMLADIPGKLVEMATGWGKDLITNMISGFKDKLGSLKSAVGGVAGTIAKYLHFSVPEVGPLSDFDESGGDMIDVFTEGMYSQMGTLKTALNKTAGVIAGGMSPNYSAQLAGISGQLAGMGGGQIVIPVSIGGERLDTIITKTQNNINFRSGGH